MPVSEHKDKHLNNLQIAYKVEPCIRVRPCKRSMLLAKGTGFGY
jgi:hypothetical protein